ncbi:MAG: hypothetical protein II816_03680 [Elusimicrobia bacterium]|nr:hypothetical protein [Elusimicrobiota bacterium]
MIVNIETLQAIPVFSDLSEDELVSMAKGIELAIRAYTNNNFQNRYIRFEAASLSDKCFGSSPFLKVGDTVQISQSNVNDGLYVITEITNDYITLDSELFAVDSNLITKVEYPVDVVQGVINLMKWEVENREKVGIKSETLSRHSVTYYDQDANNTAMGYPVALLGFLKPYMKVRF